MIILLSPSKTLDTTTPFTPSLALTQPALIRESEALMKLLRRKTVADIQTLMSLSEKLAALNHARFGHWHTPFTSHNARPAFYTFMGDVYEGLDAASFNPSSVARAQKHLRILSGLYGLLRPLDLMQPYRLEMGTKLANARGKNLYAFWGDRVTEQLNQEKSSLIVNLASQEYFSVVKPALLKSAVVTPIFKEAKGNQMKVVGLFAKRARGVMARYLLTKNIKTQEEMQQFDADGYHYRPDLSTDAEMLFVRQSS